MRMWFRRAAETRGTVAVALGYLLAFSLADAKGLIRSSWVVLAIAICGAVAAAAGIRAFPGTLRLLLGAASIGGFTVLGVIGFRSPPVCCSPQS